MKGDWKYILPWCDESSGFGHFVVNLRLAKILNSLTCLVVDGSWWTGSLRSRSSGTKRRKCLPSPSSWSTWQCGPSSSLTSCRWWAWTRTASTSTWGRSWPLTARWSTGTSYTRPRWHTFRLWHFLVEIFNLFTENDFTVLINDYLQEHTQLSYMLMNIDYLMTYLHSCWIVFLSASLAGKMKTKKVDLKS